MPKIDVKGPVYDFIRRQAPEPRRALKHALKELEREEGDIRALEQNLAGYCRLRVGKYRLIFRYAVPNTIEAIFLEERSIVYEIFEAQLLAKLPDALSTKPKRLAALDRLTKLPPMGEEWRRP